MGLPAPAGPLQTEGNLPTCPCAQLCASDTLARGRRQRSVLGFWSHTCWGAVGVSGCGVSVSGSQRGVSSSGLSQIEFLLALRGGTRFDEERRPCKATDLTVTRGFGNTRNAAVSGAKLLSVLSDLSLFPIPDLPCVTLCTDALWTLAAAENPFNRNCLAQESVLHSSFFLWESRQCRRSNVLGLLSQVPL